MTETNEADSTTDTEQNPAPDPKPSPDGSESANSVATVAPVTRGTRLRRDLLAKLPPLPTRTWTMDHWINLRADSDVRVVLDLDADAFLEPLEQFVPAGRK